MDVSKLEQIERHIHIISALERGAAFGGDIWQTGSSNHREVFKIVQIKVDSLQDKVLLRLNSLHPVEQNYPIFIRLRYRNIIFKLEPHEFRVTDGKLICSVPKDIKALAQRPTDRYVLPVEQNVSLSMRRLGRDKEDAPNFDVRVIDVSERGLGILISGVHRDYFKPYDRFWIKAIGNAPLNRDIFCTVLYVSPKGYFLKNSDVRIGLSLGTALSWDTFSALKKKCRTVLTA